METPIKVPKLLQSSTFGELSLHESRIEFGAETFHECTYEAKVTSVDDGEFGVVLNPDFDWPYPENSLDVLSALLAAAESRHAQLCTLGTTGVFGLQRHNICQLGERTGYERWGATETQLFTHWKLHSKINFVDGFRLIYAEHPIYYLDLILDFDSSWRSTQVQFDG